MRDSLGNKSAPCQEGTSRVGVWRLRRPRQRRRRRRRLRTALRAVRGRRFAPSARGGARGVVSGTPSPHLAIVKSACRALHSIVLHFIALHCIALFGAQGSKFGCLASKFGAQSSRFVALGSRFGTQGSGFGFPGPALNFLASIWLGLGPWASFSASRKTSNPDQKIPK